MTSTAIAPFCHLAAAPLSWVPDRVHGMGLSLILNRLLAQPLAEGELAFLFDRVVAIRVSDIGIEYRLRLSNGRFMAETSGREADVRFSGDAYAFLQLVTQREDPDTLFFQRRLRIEGNTALGLNLKNFLDALEVSPLPAPARRALERLTQALERYCIRPAS